MPPENSSRTIAVINRQRRHRISSREVRRVAARILSASGFPDSELTISIVGDRAIRRMNREYLGKDRPTNVISFPMGEGEFGGVNPQILGDVVVSIDTAAREASDAGVPLMERFHFLVMHGILHLVGYDHERSGEGEARRMRARERVLFRMLREDGLV